MAINELIPHYESLHEWEFYSSNLHVEYQQSLEEGLHIEGYKDLFHIAVQLPRGDVQKRLGDILFDIVTDAEVRADYPFAEPSDLDAIKSLRKSYEYAKKQGASIEKRIEGAWFGRVCGCMLGKTLEGITVEEIDAFLKETNNYPLHRYVLRSDLTEERMARYNFPFQDKACIDDGIGMPYDDDTNYTVLYQEVVKKYGRSFTPYDVSRQWLALQSKDSYCTAERVAFCNFVNGYTPPESAIYKNPYREWIGAQIRGDYFGYINPGKPEAAAEMAWRDATVSHTKNGIYGEMWVAAMLAVAADTDDIEDIILAGLAQIPHTSRLYGAINLICEMYHAGNGFADCMKAIEERYNSHTAHGWCHTISNAMIVAASLLYGGGDYGKSICLAVGAGYDTDCNGATVGSVIGMAKGVDAVGREWIDPINDTLETSLFGIGTVKISDRVQMTFQHIE